MAQLVKIWTLIFGLAIVYSGCSSQKKIEKEQKQFDVYSITFNEFDAFSGKITHPYQYVFLRHQLGDSVMIYSYFLNNLKTPDYRFDIKNGQFNFIKSDDFFDLVAVDTFSVVIKNSKFEVIQFKTVNPPADGNASFLFNKNFGLVGIGYLSWGNGEILTEINGVNIEKEIVKQLLSDSTYYLKRKPNCLDTNISKPKR